MLPDGNASISNNTIYNNSTGITCYNSSPKIIENNIHDNSEGGIKLLSESCPIIRGNMISDSGTSSYLVPEIQLESGSYPVIDDGKNDINTDGCGYSLGYGVGSSGTKLKHLEARNNFWSYTTLPSILNTISPSDWSVNVVPFCTSSNTPYYIPEDPFKMALTAEIDGDFSTAAYLYKSIASTTPDSLVALQSLGRLNNIYAQSDTLVPDIRNVYTQYFTACCDSSNIKSADHLEIMLDRIEGEYSSALSSYELLLEDSDTLSDSLIYLLDISYTIEEMLYDDPDKSENTGITYNKHGLNITSKESAKTAIRSLLSRLLSSSAVDNGYTYMTPPVVKISNYPNPFNPSTTIIYSMPRSDKIKMSVYNIKGQWIKDLVDDTQIMGNHKAVWDGSDANGRSVCSGIYFVRARTSGRSVNHKIMLLK